MRCKVGKEETLHYIFKKYDKPRGHEFSNPLLFRQLGGQSKTGKAAGLVEESPLPTHDTS